MVHIHTNRVSTLLQNIKVFNFMCMCVCVYACVCACAFVCVCVCVCVKIPDEYLRFSDKIKLLDLLLSTSCKTKTVMTNTIRQSNHHKTHYLLFMFMHGSFGF